MYYTPPKLRLVPREQKVISLALSGLTDTDIAEKLGMSHDGVRQRWKRIIEHIEDELPDLFTPDGDVNPAKRGLEKRRKILAYLSTRPSELRPFHLKR